MALEGHFALYLTLNKIYLSSFLDENQEIEKDLKEAIVNAICESSDYTNNKNALVKQKHESLLESLQALNLSSMLDNYDKFFKVNQSRFYRSICHFLNQFCSSDVQLENNLGSCIYKFTCVFRRSRHLLLLEDL